MSADQTFLRKELQEYWYTWRVRLLVIPVIFLALTGPVLAYFAPEILSAALGTQSGPLPEAVWQDVYHQWVGNLQQIVPFLLIVIAAGAIAGECATGTIIPIVAGGYSRQRIVVIKYVVQTVVGIIVIAVGTLITWAAGLPLFPDIAFAPTLRITAVAAPLVALLVAITTLASSAISSTLGAAGASIAVYLGISGLTFWPLAREWTPVGLLPLLGNAVTDSGASIVWPTISSIAISIICVVAATIAFEHRELSGS
ncbi:MAG: ABC transporter permease [Thermomicrobiales bacterium]|nr:ABC transporter permease [Thermomicrobiales bacterium]MCO5226263.1 ABC transporter permease [Thermomicrobiales bacterium]MCO5228437.1 ABC transporter permease [Thermomicrobiales bacterium]